MDYIVGEVAGNAGTGANEYSSPVTATFNGGILQATLDKHYSSILASARFITLAYLYQGEREQVL